MTAVPVQDDFFSTQLAQAASSRWLGGPQVLLQGTLNGSVSNVIVIMDACVRIPNSPALEDTVSSVMCIWKQVLSSIIDSLEA